MSRIGMRDRRWHRTTWYPAATTLTSLRRASTQPSQRDHPDVPTVVECRQQRGAFPGYHGSGEIPTHPGGRVLTGAQLAMEHLGESGPFVVHSRRARGTRQISSSCRNRQHVRHPRRSGVAEACVSGRAIPPGAGPLNFSGRSHTYLSGCVLCMRGHQTQAHIL